MEKALSRQYSEQTVFEYILAPAEPLRGLAGGCGGHGGNLQRIASRSQKAGIGQELYSAVAYSDGIKNLLEEFLNYLRTTRWFAENVKMRRASKCLPATMTQYKT